MGVQFVLFRSVMKTIATLRATLLLLYLCGSGSASDCQLGGRSAVICAQCSNSVAGVRWTALADGNIFEIQLWYYCYTSEGTDLQLQAGNDVCFKGGEIPAPTTLRRGSETVSLFHVVDSTLSPGTQCTFNGIYKDFRTPGKLPLEPTSCTIKNTTECWEYPSSCQLPATCVSEGDNCNCHCNEGFAGHSEEIFSGANCSSIGNKMSSESLAPTGSLTTSTVSVLPVPTSNRTSTESLAPTGSLTTSTVSVLPIPTGNRMSSESLAPTGSLTTSTVSVLPVPTVESDIPAALAVAVPVVCVAALLICATSTVILLALHGSRWQTNRLYGLKFTDTLMEEWDG